MYRISSIFGLQYYKYSYCSSLPQFYFLIKSRVLKDFMACNNDAIEYHTYEMF